MSRRTRPNLCVPLLAHGADLTDDLRGIDPQRLGDAPGIVLIGPERLSELLLSAGLFGWLIDKAG